MLKNYQKLQNSYKKIEYNRAMKIKKIFDPFPILR